MAGNLQTSTKVFNDPIHGHIELHPLLICIIDTPQFQRLRYIKQLGGQYYVFPGASNNRFEHSIGVAYLAGCLIEELRKRQPELEINEQDVLSVQIAGLCHDLGHGPFSHLYDGRFMPLAAPGKKFQHEDASLKMFDHLINSNKLEDEMKNYGLVIPDDLIFIKELILGKKLNDNVKGRGKEKHFLYEIVANKISGVDVDKMDYFARDCHHLGMQCNFDCKRFLTLARVCQTSDGRHICLRDKEVWNMYDFFYTRYCLHQRAYQHRVTKVVEIMITDAFLKAHPHIKIKGSGEEYYTISGAVDDMDAYTLLTDNIFQQILHSTDENLKEARDILDRIQRRELYVFVGETKRDAQSQTDIMETCERYKAELAQYNPELFNKDDFRVDIVVRNYGMKDKNPVTELWFYRKTDPNNAYKIPQDQVGRILPNVFQESFIRVYCTRMDQKEAARECFEQWYKNLN